jgi:DNA-binding Xre family transcriptional regulator
VRTGAQLRRLLAERAGMSLSSAGMSALLTRHPAQLKLSTLAALCTALDCTLDDLLEIHTTPVAAAQMGTGRAGVMVAVVAGPPAGHRGTDRALVDVLEIGRVDGPVV